MKHGLPLNQRLALRVPPVELLDPAVCWNWQGCKRKGYGAITINGKTWDAHRLAYTVANGSIPEKMVVMHTCDNPACVNPAHLRLGYPADNVADMVAKGRHRTGSRKKQCCPQGHVFTFENTGMSGNKRWCRTCHARRQRDYRNRSMIGGVHGQ